MSTLEAKTRYDAAEVEPRIVERWLDSGLFHPEPEATPDENYSIAVPPPNVTGALHMGHALNGSIQDVLDPLPPHARRSARSGSSAPTTPASRRRRRSRSSSRGGHAAARRSAARSSSERVWEWREQYGGDDHRAVPAARRLARLRRRALHARRALPRGGAEGLRRPLREGPTSTATTTWSTGTRAAARRSPTSRSRTARSSTRSTTSTTRSPTARDRSPSRPCARRRCSPTPRSPCNPDDERYAHLVGETAILPLVGRELPIIADDYVKPEFGTGALKITPGHDPNDFEIGRAPRARGDHRDRRGRAHDRGGGRALRGPHGRSRRRRRSSPALREEGAARQTPRRTRTTVPVLAPLRRAHRAAHLAAVVHAHGRARRAGDRGREGRPRADPPRALGARLPRLDGEHPPVVRLAPAVVGPPAAGLVPRRGDLRRRRRRRRATAGRRTPTCSTPGSPRRCGRSRRSAGPSDTPELRAFYPTDVLSTARDILFLWVARMVMMGLEFAGDVPFDDVYIHSVIQAPDGRRMSKSLGTGHRPARRDRQARRRRRALRPAHDVLDRRTCALGREGRSRASSSRTSSGTPRG